MLCCMTENRAIQTVILYVKAKVIEKISRGFVIQINDELCDKKFNDVLVPTISLHHLVELVILKNLLISKFLFFLQIV